MKEFVDNMSKSDLKKLEKQRQSQFMREIVETDGDLYNRNEWDDEEY